MTDDAIRASDAERDRAADLLGEHYAAGRLDAAEWQERIDAVHAARTRSEVESVFADLPVGGGAVPSQVSGSSRGATPAPTGGHDWFRAAGTAAVVLAVLVVVVAVGWAAWPAFLVLAVLGRRYAYRGTGGGSLGRGRRPRGRF